MTKLRWKKSYTSVYNIAYHLIWCPKYRRKVLVGDIALRLRYLLVEKAEDLECDIQQLEIMPDHVHVFIKATPVLAPQQIVAQLKGFSAHKLRKEFPSLKSRLPSLWTRSYYCESIGHISEDVIRHYIEDQKNQ
jgi:putative transposase